MKNDRSIDLGLTGYEELFMSTEERLDAKKPRVEAIPLAALTPFRNHPFQVKEDEEMAQLMRSIADAGVLSPALARPLPDGGYELISGHRRLAACKALGMDTMPVITQMVKGKIVPYFRKTGVKLGELQARHIQSFYLYELKTVSASTVIHEHANIHKALKYAVKMDLIPYNPADKVERPKKQKYIADYYRLEELEQLFEATKDHPYSLLIQITAFYGLRRSEALGLRWDAIDFERNTITIRHIVTNAKIDGKYEIIREDRAKTKSSLRSLPLVGNIREKLLALKEQQKENKRICGNCYNREYDGYVFVDAMGNIFNPRNLSSNFSKLLEMNGLRHIRFHDLRHSCASLLLANDVPMKQIQEWLGHSDISTTANIYSHLDYKSKLTSANVMDNILSLPDTAAAGWQT